MPKRITDYQVLLLDPMIATGGSLIKAIEVLLEAGVAEDQIISVHVLGCKEGLGVIQEAFPKIKIVLASIEPKLDGTKYLQPGLGDFGCRYFGTG